jgi:hypothetical protein
MELESFAQAVVTPLAIVFITIRAIKVTRSTPSLSHRSLKRPHLYEDSDGTTTPSSIENYSDTLPKFQAIIAALVGLLVATSSLLFKATSSTQADDVALLGAWTRVAAWVRL